MQGLDLKKLKIEVENEIEKAGNLKELDEIFRKYLGKKGKITQILRSLKNLPERKRKETGKLANQIKKEIGKIIKEKKEKFQVSSFRLQEKWFDITVPGKKPAVGHLHPLTLTIRKATEIFQNLGFTVIEGPEIEDGWHNFDALNIPPNHPARDLWNTIWLKNGKTQYLLRTHTSPVQIHYMEKNNPPLRIIAPGRVFRYEATDASHEINFYQLEGLMIGKDISVANFKAVIQEFFSRFFGREIEIRLRPSFFPFVEPGFEVDISCFTCGSRGCSVCKKTGWIEIMGAGMVHPNVLKAGGINPKLWQGFAFGMGMDRLAMMKFKINDIRLFYSSDLRFLNQF